MESAIKFQDWKFLEDHFQGEEEKAKWQGARDRTEKEAEDWNRVKSDVLESTMVFRLSRSFRMFNEAAIPTPNLKDVVQNTL